MMQWARRALKAPLAAGGAVQQAFGGEGDDADSGPLSPG